ncbi:transposase [Streptomyces sp. ISL-22]|uniref:transposase n=1 Tax=unclassified Streptomyces TaxID=2593676 RepID=UPI001BECE405|nr:transposase [Streptomyces sp. ISL-24]MBT2433528.1 transposase [Streptomyces sp. ISL-22]
MPWAEQCPGHHESADRVRSTRVRPGNPYLKGALGMAAFGAARTKNSYLQARCKRLTARRGPIRALIAVEHSIITAIWRAQRQRALPRPRWRLLHPTGSRTGRTPGRVR